MRLSVIAKSWQWGGLSPLGLSSHGKINKQELQVLPQTCTTNVVLLGAYGSPSTALRVFLLGNWFNRSKFIISSQNKCNQILSQNVHHFVIRDRQTDRVIWQLLCLSTGSSYILLLCYEWKVVLVTEAGDSLQSSPQEVTDTAHAY
jgi:hypothetical protein